MKATNIGKTILVWDKLSNDEVIRLIKVLKNIIMNYRLLTQDNTTDKPVPIALKNDNNYLCVIKKCNEVMVCATKITDKNLNFYPYSYNAILNADFLYDSIDILENSFEDMQSHLIILQKFPQTKWIELPFHKSFENYCLSPNINPENFIKHLEQNTLSNTYKQFLKEAGFSIKNSAFSKELQDTIKEANDLFIEER